MQGAILHFSWQKELIFLEDPLIAGVFMCALPDSLVEDYLPTKVGIIKKEK